MKDELAQALLELWEEYLANASMTFQPTMTDFIGWLKDHQFGEDVKDVRYEEPFNTYTKRDENLAITTGVILVKTASENELAAAQSTLGKPFKAAGKLHARKLRREGYSLAAIQKTLKEDGYVNVPLETIIRAVEPR